EALGAYNSAIQTSQGKVPFDLTSLIGTVSRSILKAPIANVVTNTFGPGNQTIGSDLGIADYYAGKGKVQHALKRYEEALAAYEQAVRLDPETADYYAGKGKVLHALKRYEEAL